MPIDRKVQDILDAAKRSPRSICGAGAIVVDFLEHSDPHRHTTACPASCLRFPAHALELVDHQLVLRRLALRCRARSSPAPGQC
jgi:hypothetical protein